jgi:hypothetical protein
MALIIGLEFCVIFSVMMRKLPVVQSMVMVQARFFLVVWLGLYLLAELAPLNLEIVYLILLAFGFAFAPTPCSRFDRADHESLIRRSPFVPQLASRAPPVL